MSYNQIALGVSTGVGGSITAFLFGGWSALLSFFLFIVVADILTGIGAAAYESIKGTGTGLSSTLMQLGLIKKIYTVVAIVLAHQFDVIMGTDIVMQGAIWGFAAMELLSITENYGRMNLPLPQVMTNIIEVIKNKKV